MMTFEGHVNRSLLFVWVESRSIFSRCIGQHSVSSKNYVHYVSCKYMCLLWPHYWHWKYSVDRDVTTYWRINYNCYKLGTNVTSIKKNVSFISVLFVCLFFINLACLSLRISPKFQSRTNVPLHSRSFIVQFLSLLSGWLSSRWSFAHQRV